MALFFILEINLRFQMREYIVLMHLNLSLVFFSFLFVFVLGVFFS